MGLSWHSTSASSSQTARRNLTWTGPGHMTWHIPSASPASPEAHRNVINVSETPKPTLPRPASSLRPWWFLVTEKGQEAPALSQNSSMSFVMNFRSDLGTYNPPSLASPQMSGPSSTVIFCSHRQRAADIPQRTERTGSSHVGRDHVASDSPKNGHDRPTSRVKLLLQPPASSTTAREQEDT